jgi:hypothetical protein
VSISSTFFMKVLRAAFLLLCFGFVNFFWNCCNFLVQKYWRKRRWWNVDEIDTRSKRVEQSKTIEVFEISDTFSELQTFFLKNKHSFVHRMDRSWWQLIFTDFSTNQLTCLVLLHDNSFIQSSIFLLRGQTSWEVALLSYSCIFEECVANTLRY